jgi:ABC-type phosphate/phosphonate transport system substrate-binding protein
MNLPRRRIWFHAVGALVIICFSSALPAQVNSHQDSRFTFWSVRTGPETEPDDALVKLLTLGTRFNVEKQQAQQYETVIHTLVEATQKANTSYLARVPPYVFVAAEMLGADIEPLATYRSVATDDVVYHSWFVVKRQDLIDDEIVAKDPSLDDLLKFIHDHSSKQKPVKFIYHDKFSTSSYFLPSLFFSRHDIFAIKGNDFGEFDSIYSEKAPGVESSSQLPALVLKGDSSAGAVIAAIFDGTKKKIAPEVSKDLVFIRLPTQLPNDLLVCSKWMNYDAKRQFQEAIKTRKLSDAAASLRINVQRLGDFKEWQSIDEAEEADKSLAELRHLAQVHPSDVTVEVVATDSRMRNYLEVIKNAVRLSRTEFVLHDPSFHGPTVPDYKWTIEPTHDGAISLTSEINGFQVPRQVFPISFTDDEDLTKRVCALIQSRLHRIRYVWPYEDDTATVIRDFDTNIDGSLEARKIVWRDPVRDHFEPYRSFPVAVQSLDFHRLRLESSQFPLTNEKKLDFDPMSNISYQVLLIRPSEQSLMFRVLTYTFVASLALAAFAAIWDFRRKAKSLAAAAADGDLAQSYRATWEKYYQSWHPTGKNGKCQIADANVIWCNRELLEKFIAGLKRNANPEFDGTRKRKFGWGIFAKIPLLKDFLQAGGENSVNYEWVYEPSKVDDPERLSGVVPFLVETQRLAPFIGTQLEWDVLNMIALNAVQRPPVATQLSLNGNHKVVSRDNPIVQRLVSSHFNEVLGESMSRASFFNKSWQLAGENNGLRIFEHRESIIYRNGSDVDTPSEMILSFTLPKEAYLNGDLVNGKLNAWLLGRIHKRDSNTENGAQSLRIDFKPMALLKE